MSAKNIAYTGILVSCILFLKCGEEPQRIPSSRQTEHRVAEIADLALQRAGYVTLTVTNLQGDPNGAPVTQVNYLLQAPQTSVKDTDIRGFLDGKVKYGFNQGTSYHMRIGRRYNGPYQKEYELKRSLIRWVLPSLPDGAQIASAQITLWIEEYLIDSPLGRGKIHLPLHLYTYPLSTDWGPGHGGVNQDDFSRAAEGEASWNAALSGMRRWPAPGVLQPALGNAGERYVSSPLAVSEIAQDDSPLVISAPRLLAYIQDRRQNNQTVDVLLKLDNAEEDRVGTELAFLSSNYGDPKDTNARRPQLELEVEIRRPRIRETYNFVLESGAERVFPRTELPGGPVLISANVGPDEPTEIKSAAWVRGGTATDTAGASEWIPLLNPMKKTWDWLQIKISAAPNRISWGQSFSVEILSTWVQPGPREKQAPELLLIAPSGTIYRVQGTPEENGFHYTMDFTPREIGLWKYGWSFRPAEPWPLGSHQGKGMFYVSFPKDSRTALKRFAAYLEGALVSVSPFDRTLQTKLNNFVRVVSRIQQRDPARQEWSDSLLNAVRNALNSQ